MSIGGAGPFTCYGALAAALACGPQARPEHEGSTSASEATSSADPGGTTTTGTAPVNPTTSTITTTTSTGADTTLSDPSTGGPPLTPDLPAEPPWAPIACDSDEFEANDEPVLATPLDAPCETAFRDHWDCYAALTACHGLGDSDWYMLPATPAPGQPAVLEMQLLIEPELDACNCSNDPWPMGPELAATIEVFDLQTQALVGSLSNMDPVLWFWDQGVAFSQPLLIHVIGPPQATWTYRLWIYRQDEVWEDSCEC